MKFTQAIPFQTNIIPTRNTPESQSPLDFEKFAKELDQKTKDYSKINLDEIETRWVKKEVVDEHGQIREVMKEVAICPECGEENCPCIARITVQARLDEENAKGVRHAKKPDPMSIVPQSFAQMSVNLEQKSSTKPFGA